MYTTYCFKETSSIPGGGKISCEVSLFGHWPLKMSLRRLKTLHNKHPVKKRSVLAKKKGMSWNYVTFITAFYLALSPEVYYSVYTRSYFSRINRLTPNDPYMCRTAPLTSKRCILYIYPTSIGTEYFKHALYSPFFFSSKCSLFHNANLFGSCMIHILYTGCTKIKKKNNSDAKGLKGTRVNLTIHVHPVPKLRICGDVIPFPINFGVQWLNLGILYCMFIF